MTHSRFLTGTDDLEQLRQQYEGARSTYMRTKAYPDWTIACEAQGRYRDAKRKAEAT